jgi:hypothetical protein
MKYDTKAYIISALIVICIISFFGALIIFLYDQKITLYSILPFVLFIILAIIVVVMIFLAQIVNTAANIGDNIGNSLPCDIGVNCNNSPQQIDYGVNGQLLLKDPISIYNNLPGMANIQPPPGSANYTISFWFYPNNSGQLNNIEILKYGNYAPYIMFSANNTLHLFPSNQFVVNKQPTVFTIPTQKWNYIVIQYVGGTSLQFFVNCNLISTVAFDQTNAPTYSSTDVLHLGNHNPASIGIGAISNVNYYTNPLTNTQMQNQYAILSSQVIPTSF